MAGPGPGAGTNLAGTAPGTEEPAAELRPGNRAGELTTHEPISDHSRAKKLDSALTVEFEPNGPRGASVGWTFGVGIAFRKGWCGSAGFRNINLEVCSPHDD